MERNKLWGLLIAAALLLGLGAWLLGRDRGGGDGVDEDTTAIATERTGEDRPAPRRASARPDLRGEAKAAIAGTVRDREGQPIAGAQVCAWPHLRDLEGVPPGTPRCTESEADGHYRLDGQLPIRVIVNAEARGHLPQRWFGRHETYREEFLQLSPGQTREGVDFALQPGGVAIEGVVRDISGGVIEDAFVWVGSNGFEESGRSAGRSDEQGRFSLWSGPGRVLVQAEAEGYAEGSRLSALPGPTVEVLMTPESVIVGRVVMAGTGEPVSGVVIEAEGEAFFSGGQSSVRSDDAGRFRIDKLEPGVYTLGAHGDELYGEAPELVHLGLAETAEGLLIELHPAFMVSGEVVFAGGTEPRPCPQGTIHLADRADPRNSKVARIRAGEVELRSLLPGTYEVEIRCEGARSEPSYEDLIIADASRSGLTWEVREGLAIRGEVVDDEGRGVEGVRVHISMKTDPANPREQQTSSLSDPTTDDGRFTAAGLLPGTYEVRVFAFDRANDAEPVEVELEPGADVNDVRIEFPADGTITGLVRDADGQPVAGVQLRAMAVTRRSNAVGLSDDEGRFILEHVPPGEVRITVMDGMAQLRAPGTSDDDEQGTLAAVEPGGTVEVEIVIESRNATIRGRVLDEQGAPVPDAFVSHRRMADSAAAGKGRGKQRLRWGFDRPGVLTDTDGSFTIEGVAGDASFVIGAFRKGGGEAIAEDVRPGERVELTIVDTGELAGKVVRGEGDAPPARFKVTVRNDAEGLTRSDELFRSGGAFRMKELPPGTYTLIVDSPAGAARLEDIELGPGEAKDDLVLTLTPRVTVRGRLVDIDTREPIAGLAVSVGARGTSMRFRAEQGEDLPHVSDADGRFEVANALTGKVILAVDPRSFSKDQPYSWMMMSYVIPEGEGVVDLGEVELVANRVDRDTKPGDIGFVVKESKADAEPEDFVPTVALIDPGGPAEGSGLAVGDRIESVDGHDVKGINGPRFARLTKVAPGDSFELGLAGGKSVRITAGPPKE